uniref:Putative E3 ubiquitin-protein ligase IE1 n=1 Tax=Anthurium amnicola TaxID=1678845 RepID=A0A1D1Y1Y2_9ARAE
MTTKGEKFGGDVEAGAHQPPEASASDGSVCSFDGQNQSWHSPHHSHCEGSSFVELRLSDADASTHEVGGVRELCRNPCVSDCSGEIDLDNGVPEIKINMAKVEKDCRICHLKLVNSAQECGIPIELGCSCKGDLAAAHKECAETWFKIKGNKTCEICGTVAKNVLGTGEAEFIEQWNETSSTVPAAPAAESRRFWLGHRFLNFLLASVVFAFVISWLFHFNIPG